MEKKKRKTGRPLSWYGAGFLDGTSGVRYRDEILQQQEEPFMQNHPEVEMFLRDNARPHTARVCTASLVDAEIDVMDWPAKSPDLNPVANVWAVLGDKAKKRDNPPRNLGKLTMALQEEWQAIPQRTSGHSSIP